MTIQENVQRLRKFLSPDICLLPLKIHMFLYLGSLSGAIPFGNVLAKQLGISAALVGVINTVLPFLAVIAKFAIGSLADSLQKLKLVLVLTIITEATFHFLIIFITPIGDYGQINHLISPNCSRLNDTLGYLPLEFNAKCDILLNNTERSCYIACACDVDGSCPVISERKIDSFSCGADRCSTVSLESEDYFRMCQPGSTYKCKLSCAFKPKEELRWQEIVFSSQFWLFSLFKVTAGVAASVGLSLTDAATYAILKDKKEYYGRQRLWGTAGWGALAPIIGVLNQVATGENAWYIDFNPGFYMMAALTALDMIGLTFLNVPSSVRSKSLLKDVKSVFAKSRTIFFTSSVFIMGCFTGLVWTYALWYLQELGGSSTLLGVNLAVQCFGGEVTVFFFSGWIIKKIGYGHAVSLSIAAMALRMAVYAFMSNPWVMLPVEVTHGLTFGLFYAALTSYASTVAVTGTEATLQGILGGTFEGLGIAVGSLISGILYDKYSGRTTFVIFFFASLAFLVLHVVIDFLFRRRDATKENHNRAVENLMVNGKEDHMLIPETAVITPTKKDAISMNEVVA